MKVSPTLLFEGGSVTVNATGYGAKDGSGYLAFKDDDLQWDDYETRFVNVAKSELEGIRDFLIQHLGVPA